MSDSKYDNQVDLVTILLDQMAEKVAVKVVKSIEEKLPQKMEQEFLSKQEASKLLGVRTNTLTAYQKLGLPYLKLPSGAVRFNRQEIIDYMNAHKVIESSSSEIN